jgi:hypothetical protein
MVHFLGSMRMFLEQQQQACMREKFFLKVAA